MARSISILSCGWLGLPLGKVLCSYAHEVKGATTSANKLSIINDAGIKAFQLKGPGLRADSGFFETDVLIITLPPSIHGYVQIMGEVVEKLVAAVIKKVIFISSTSIYPNLNCVVVEKDAANIVSAHSGVALLEVEEMFRQHKSFDTTILRLAGLYGPGREPGKFLAGKKELAGADNPINLVHQEDCIGVIKTILEQEIWNRTFNVCAPSHPTRKEFYASACKKMGLEPPAFSQEKAPYKEVSCENLVRETGYTFKHPNPMLDL